MKNVINSVRSSFISVKDFIAKRLQNLLCVHNLSFSGFLIKLQFQSEKAITIENKTEHAVQSYAAGKTTLKVMLRMKILNNKSFIAEY